MAATPTLTSTDKKIIPGGSFLISDPRSKPRTSPSSAA